jgi:hypothetical protein
MEMAGCNALNVGRRHDCFSVLDEHSTIHRINIEKNPSRLTIGAVIGFDGLNCEWNGMESHNNKTK